MLYVGLNFVETFYLKASQAILCRYVGLFVFLKYHWYPDGSKRHSGDTEQIRDSSNLKNRGG